MTGHRPAAPPAAAWAVAGLIALAPLTNLHVGAARPMRLVLPALAGGLLIYLLLAARRRDRQAPDAVVITVLVFTAAAVASALFALDPADSITKVFSLLTALMVFFAVLQLGSSRRTLMVMLSGVLGALLIAAAQGVLQHERGEYAEVAFLAGGDLVGRVQGSFGHPNQYGGFIAVLLPLAAAVALSRGFGLRLRGLAFAAFALGLPALSWSYARGAIIAAVAGGVVWLALLRPRAALVAAAVTLVLVVTVAPAELEERVTSASGEDVELRSDLWRAAVDIYAERPLLGVGLNNFQEGYARLPAPPPSAEQRRLLHHSQVLTPPHANSLYLNVLAEQGVIGALVLLLLFGALLNLAWAGSRGPEPGLRAVAIGLGAGTLALMAHSVLEVTLYGEIAWPLLALVAITARLAAVGEEVRASGESGAASRRRPPGPLPAGPRAASSPG